MGPFGALDTAASGMAVSQDWLDAVSDNVANVSTVRPAGEAPFRARLVVAAARADGSGVDAVGIDLQGGQPQQSYDPSNPLADKAGYVTQPVVDLSEQMTNMLVASRLYQANLDVMSDAKETYSQAIAIGNKS